MWELDRVDAIATAARAFCNKALAARKRGKFSSRRLWKKQRNTRHTFNPSDEVEISLTASNAKHRLGDGLGPGSTISLHGNCRNMIRNARAQRGDSRQVRGICRLRHAAKNHFIDPAGIDPRSHQDPEHGGARQIRGAHSG